MALTKIPANMLSGVDLGNSVRVNLGSSNNLALFHTGGNGVIHNTTGELRIRANTLKLQDYSNEDLMIVANSNGSVDLYHNNQKKFETSATGASVTGNLAVSGNLTVSGTTTELDTTNLNVTDKNITLNYHASSDTSSTADGAGITIQDAVNASTDATLLWDASNDEFDFSHPVNITGGLNLSGDIYGTGHFDIRSTGNIFNTYGNSSNVYFRTQNGISKVIITSGGNVGIGTESPSSTSMLTVDSGTTDDGYSATGFNSNSQIKIDVASTQNNYAGIQFSHSGNTEGFIGLVRPSSTVADSDFVIQGYSSNKTGYTEYLRISDEGNLGLGTTSPSHSANYHTLDIRGANGGQIIAGRGSYIDYFMYTDSTSANIGALNDIHFEAGSAGGQTPKMIIKSSGNVGIGLTGPDYPLEVAGAGTVSIAYQRTGVSAKKWGFHSDNSHTYWQNITDSVLALSLTNAGLLSAAGGLKTTQTAALALELAGTYSGGNYIGWKKGSAAEFYIGSSNTVGAGSGYYDLYAVAGLGLRFFTGAGERLRIDSSGNVGIGTGASAITGKLQVESGSAHNDVYITSTANGGTGYDATLHLLGSASNSESKVNLGSNNNPDAVSIKSYQNILTLRTNDNDRAYINATGQFFMNSNDGGTGKVTAATTWSGGKFMVRETNGFIDMQSSGDSQTVGYRLGYRENTDLAGYIKYGTGYAQMSIENNYTGNNGQNEYSTIYFKNKNHSNVLKSRMRIGGANGYISTNPVGNAGQASQPFEVQGGTAGNVFMGNNLAGYTVGQYPVLGTSGGDLHFQANNTYTGYISFNSGFTDVSDEREKENITTISNATSKLKQLRGVTHTWKDNRDDGATHLGLIAQEVKAVVPEVVSEGPTKPDETEPTLGVHYGKLVPLLIETIKELEARITTLEG